MKKRILAMLLTVCMVLSMLPMSALAARVDDEPIAVVPVGEETHDHDHAHEAAKPADATDAQPAAEADETVYTPAMAEAAGLDVHYFGVTDGAFANDTTPRTVTLLTADKVAVTTPAAGTEYHLVSDGKIVSAIYTDGNDKTAMVTDYAAASNYSGSGYKFKLIAVNSATHGTCYRIQSCNSASHHMTHTIKTSNTRYILTNDGEYFYLTPAGTEGEYYIWWATYNPVEGAHYLSKASGSGFTISDTAATLTVAAATDNSGSYIIKSGNIACGPFAPDDTATGTGTVITGQFTLNTSNANRWTHDLVAQGNGIYYIKNHGAVMGTDTSPRTGLYLTSTYGSYTGSWSGVEYSENESDAQAWHITPAAMPNNGTYYIYYKDPELLTVSQLIKSGDMEGAINRDGNGVTENQLYEGTEDAFINFGPATGWGNTVASDAALTLDFGQIKKVDRIRIVVGKNDQNKWCSYRLECSQDNANWATVQTFDGKASGQDVWELTFEEPIYTQYLRLYNLGRHSTDVNKWSWFGRFAAWGENEPANVPTCTVTFEDTTTVTLTPGECVGEAFPQQPAPRDNETFLGWYTENDELFERDTAVMKDTVVYARWRRTKLYEANENGTWDIPYSTYGVIYANEERSGDDQKSIEGVTVNGARASLAIDGIEASFYHSNYNNSDGQSLKGVNPASRWIGIDLGAEKQVSGFRYLPRQSGGGNGYVKEYAIEVSNSLEGPWKCVAHGTWDDILTNKGWRTVNFPTVNVQYVRIKGITVVGETSLHMNAAEIRAIGPDTPVLTIADNGFTHSEEWGVSSGNEADLYNEGADSTVYYWVRSYEWTGDDRDHSCVNDYLRMDFGRVKEVQQVRVVVGKDNDGDRWSQYALEYSVDGETWTTYKTYPRVTSGQDVWNERLDTPVLARYLRLRNLEDVNKWLYFGKFIAFGDNDPELDTYTVTFDEAGGSDVENAQVALGSAVGTLPEPTKEGYLFQGWFYTVGETEKQLTAATVVTGDLDVTAKWEKAVAAIGDNYYPTLQEAINAAADGQTVEVIQDAVTAALTESKSVTVNVREGVTVSVAEGKAYALAVANEGAVLTVTGSGTIQGTKYGAIAQQKGTLNVSETFTGTISGETGLRCATEAVANVCGGTITSTEANGMVVSSGLSGSRGTIHVYNGTFANVDGTAYDMHSRPNVTVHYTYFYQDEAGKVIELTEENSEAKLGDVLYHTLLEAVLEAPADTHATITLLNDVDLRDHMEVVNDGEKVPMPYVEIYDDINITLDLNGKTLRAPVINHGILTITGNGTVDASDTNDNRGYLYPAVQNYKDPDAETDLMPHTIIENGTFVSGKGEVCCVYDQAGTIEIKGGSFTATNNQPAVRKIGNDTKVEISGGTFSSDVTAFCVENKKATTTDNTVWTIVDRNYVAQIGDTKYETLEAALNAADGTVPVTLLADVTEDATLDSGVSVTLNTGDYTVKATVFVENGTLTFNGKSDTAYEGRGHEGTADNNFIVKNGANLIVTDGEIKSGCTAVYVESGTATIQGGTFSVDAGDNWWGNKFLLNLWDKAEAETASITVEGGTFEDYDPANSASENPKMDFVAPQYAATKGEDGVYTVAEAVAQVTSLATDKTKGYASVEAAIAAADLGDTVTVMKKPEGPIVIGNDKAVQLNFNERVDPQTVDVDFQANANINLGAGSNLYGGLEACVKAEDILRKGNSSGRTYFYLYKNVTLTEDIVLPARASSTSAIFTAADVTIDLAGHTISQKKGDGWNGYPAVGAYSGNLTIKDTDETGNVTGTGKIIGATIGADVYPGKTLTFESGTITSEGDRYEPWTTSYGAVVRLYGGEFVMNGGTLSNDAATDTMSGTIVFVNGDPEQSFYNDATYKLTINGGRIESVSNHVEGNNGFHSIADSVDTTQEGKINYAITGGTFGLDLTGKADAAGNPYLDNAKYWALEGTEAGTWTVQEKAVAKIGNTTYHTLKEAVEAAKDNETVTLLASVSGSGVIVNKSITIDFDGHTYTVDQTPLAGSGEKYATQAFQLLAGANKAQPNSVTMKNGTIVLPDTVENLKMGIQNYTNLTLENMTLDASQNSNITYVLSNNNGETTITGETTIKAPETGVAFDVYDYSANGYPSVKVVVDDANVTVEGKIEVSNSDKATLEISAGTFTADVNDYCVEGKCQNPAKNGGAVGSHNMGNLIEQVEPKVGVPGTKAHYECDLCGQLFDENGNEVTAEDLVIDPLTSTGVVGGTVADALENNKFVGVIASAVDNSMTQIVATVDSGYNGKLTIPYATVDTSKLTLGVGLKGVESLGMEPGAVRSHVVDTKLGNKQVDLSAHKDKLQFNDWKGFSAITTVVNPGQEDKAVTYTFAVDNANDQVTLKGNTDEAAARAAWKAIFQNTEAAVGANNSKVVVKEGSYFQAGTKKVELQQAGDLVLDNIHNLNMAALKAMFKVTEAAESSDVTLFLKKGTTLAVGTSSVTLTKDVTISSDNLKEDDVAQMVQLAQMLASGALNEDTQKTLTTVLLANIVGLPNSVEGATTTTKVPMNITIEFACEHELVLVPEVPATVREPGTKAHYKCSICGKLFDLETKEEVAMDDLVIPVLEGQGEVIALNNGGDVDGNTVTYGADTTLQFTADGNDAGRAPNHWWAGIQVKAPEGADLAKATYTVKLPWAEESEAKLWSENEDGTFWAPVDQLYIDTYGGAEKTLTFTYTFNWDGEGESEQTVTMTVQNGIVLDQTNAVATTGGLYYGTLTEAVAAAKSGDTVTLLKNASGAGVKLVAADQKNVTIDLNKHTYTVVKNPVGSAGYETQGLHFEKGNTVTVQNGTVKAADDVDAQVLIQNYCNLTLTNVTLVGGAATNYGLSCNAGTTTLNNVSISGKEGFTALDVMHWHGLYDDDAPTMTINNTADDTIDGKVAVYCYGAGSDSCENQAELTIKGGKFTANVNEYCENHDQAEGLCWNEETQVVSGHNVVTDAAVAPTYTAAGKTEGSHCSVCGEVFVKQEDIPMLKLASVTAYNGGKVVNNGTRYVTVIFDNESDELVFAADGNDYGRTPNKWWAGIHVAGAEGVNDAAYRKVSEWWNDETNIAQGWPDINWNEWTGDNDAQEDGQYWAMATPAYMNDLKGGDNQLMYRYAFDWNGDGTFDQFVAILVKDTVKFSDAGKIAKTNGIEYPTLEEAIAAVQDKGTVELLKSTAEDVVIPAGKDITLSIPAGVTLTNKSGHTIVNNGTLTITGEGTVDNVTHKKAALVNNGTATLNGGVTLDRSEEKGVDAKNNGGNSYYTVDNRGKLTVNAATVSQNGGYSSLIRNLGIENGEGKGVLEINEGAKLIGGLNNVKNDDYGTLTVNGGSFTEARQDAVMNWNVATINGGAFDKAVWNGVYTEGGKTPGKGELTIHGGNFNGEPAVKVQTSAPGTVAIDGGTFATDVNEWCKDNDNAETGYCWSTTDHTVSTHTVEEKWTNDATNHWHECSRCGHEFEKAEHTFETVVNVQATCTQEGKVTYTCSECGYQKTETTPKLAHNLTHHAAVAATCTENGTEEYWSCKDCEKLFSDADGKNEITEVGTTAAEGHTEEIIPGKAATCTETGLTEGKKCSVCGEIITAQETIPAKGHTEEIIPGKAATCTEDGLTEGVKCSVCGEIITAQETIPANGHAWDEGEVTTAATCTTDGVKTFHCANCTEIKTETIPATGHTWDEGTVTTQPTCEVPGVKTFHCTNDGCTVTKTEAIDALGHDTLTATEAVEATCTTAGNIAYWTCDRCGQKFSDVEGTVKVTDVTIPATGHTMTHHAAVAATCTTEGNVEYWSCANCNKNFADVAGVTELETVTIAELGHDFNTVWSHDGTNHWHICSRCDATDDVAEHVWGEGVVTKPATCTETGVRTFTCECGETKTETIDMIDHSYSTEWSHDGTSHWHECTVCGDKTDVTEHTWTVTEDPATCTETGLRTSTCECGETKTEVIPVLGHDFSADWTHDSMYHWHVCTRDDCDATSDRAEHVWGEGVVTTAATCTTDGVRTFTCECGATKTEVIPATGHSFTNYVSDGNATCTTDGTKTATCDHEGCDVTDTVVDLGSATGHTWDEGVVTVTATCEAPGMRLYTCTTEGCNATKVEAIPATGHSMTHHDAADADCTTAGNVEYWSCANCGKNFADENGTTELANVVIDALGHNMTHHEAVNATCTTEGSVEYWSCDRCTTNFADAEGKTELTTDTVIPALGHDFTKWASDENNHWHVCAHEGCEERLPDEEAAAHTWVNGPVSGGLRTDTCSECGATRTLVVISGGGGGTTIIYRPAPEEDLNEPDVPLAKPFLFTDVTENDWFYEAVKDVFEKELMEGINADGTLFAPYQITTRGAVATLIHRMENTPAAEKPSNFGDVEDSMWYTEAIHWTDESGVMIGYDDGNFYPNQVVTREQLALVLYRYAQFRGYDVSAKGDLSLFDDAEDVSSWAVDGMTWAVGSSLINGRNGTNLAPQGTATRAELATILQRFVSLMADADTQGE